MELILLIETATETCSVALSDCERVITSIESDISNSHSSNIAVFIDEIIKKSNIQPNVIKAVAVSKGPGSYTGLRIGVSSAKGICYGLGIPMISIDTLQSMVQGMLLKSKPKKNVLFCPMIDARRMEVYSALYNCKLEKIRNIQADIIDDSTYKDYLRDNKIIFFGNGAEKCKVILEKHKNATFIDSFKMSASYMSDLAYNKYVNKDFENTAYFEPFYLKEFIAAKPVVKGLH